MINGIMHVNNPTGTIVAKGFLLNSMGTISIPVRVDKQLFVDPMKQLGGRVNPLKMLRSHNERGMLPFFSLMAAR